LDEVKESALHRWNEISSSIDFAAAHIRLNGKMRAMRIAWNDDSETGTILQMNPYDVPIERKNGGIQLNFSDSLRQSTDRVFDGDNGQTRVEAVRGGSCVVVRFGSLF